MFVSLGGTVYAAATIDGRAIRKGSIPADRLHRNSLGGEQIKEAALGVVPNATRAGEAAHAAAADRAGSAARAASADRAEAAQEATRATFAAEAVHAKRAETASKANSTTLLGGRGVDGYVQRCGAGGVKAAAFIDTTENLPVASPRFSCTGQLNLVVARAVNKPGEYVVKVEGLDALGQSTAVIASALGINSVATVSGVGPEFRVKVFSSSADIPLENEPFTVVFF